MPKSPRTKAAASSTASRALTPDLALHVRLMGDLKGRLEAGEWPIGSRLPTELALSSEYAVSRATVRMSIKLLEAQGLVHTRHGAGTFVTALGAQMSAGLQELRSTSETIRMQGFEPTVDCHLVEHRTISPECAAAFGLPLDSKVLYLERSIRADGTLVAFCYEEIVNDLISEPFLTERFSGSLFELFKEEGQVDPAYAATEIHAVFDETVGWGEDRPEHPLYLMLRQSHFTRLSEPIVHSRNFFIEGAFKFSVMRTS